jgi:hypothetical protein
VSFGYRGNRLTCVLGEACEYEVLEEVFVDEVYGADLPDDPETIVDRGGHVGLSTLYFAVRLPTGADRRRGAQPGGSPPAAT